MIANDMDRLLLKIMMDNNEYDASDRVFAINGLLQDQYFNELSKEDQDDILMRLAIGIGAFNGEIKQELEKHDWRRLPDIIVSGNNN